MQIKKSVIIISVISIFFSVASYVLVSRPLWYKMSDVQAQKQMINVPSWSSLIEKTQPAIVVIKTESVIEQPALEFPGIPGPFRYLIPQPPEKQQGLGTGFIINEDGSIITNHHVVDGAQKIYVITMDQKEYQGKVIGADPSMDIALVKIETKNHKFPFLYLGDSEKLKLGDPVFTVGNPGGLLYSFASGYVSGMYRPGLRPSGIDLYVPAIQFQMPLNPGNSGGAIFNNKGEVVAVAQSIASPHGGQSIAFGIPIKPIIEILPKLQNGSIEQSFLGVTPDDLSSRYAKELGLAENQKGAVVVEVMPDTPAQKAGLRAMDVITEIDKKAIANAFDLRQQIAYKGVGEIVELRVYRKGDGYKNIKVKLEKRPGQTAHVLPTNQEENGLILESVGIEIQETPEKTRQELSLPIANPGAQVVNVLRRSSAEFAGLKPGDIITKVDGIPITSAKQLKNLVDKAEKEKTFMMLTRRGNAERFVPLEKR